ncbi:unnamed protein product [Rotaria sp. Silwood1]|nr:unnamed protein product [Rotaria sp. Silwood1]
MSEIPIHFRHCILYELQLGNNASAAARNICAALGEDAVADRTRRDWFNRFREGNNASAAARNICAALGEGAVADRTCRDWFNRFREGDMSLEDRPRSGCPLESDIERLKVLIKDNPRLTTHELSAMLGYHCLIVNTASLS